jgi:CheY-like chemotaxis protein
VNFREEGALAQEHRILIADDERDLVATCVRLLSRRGYACLPAYTGQQAIELIRQEHPSVVVTDLYLPDVDGLSVLRHAREHVPPIPGILMTAYSLRPLMTRAHDAGATIYLAKPFPNVALLEAIERSLRRP